LGFFTTRFVETWDFMETVAYGGTTVAGAERRRLVRETPHHRGG